MTAPLEGIRVVEITSFVAAPAAGALLADLGADVVKVEVPQGEIYRYSRPRFLGAPECEFPSGWRRRRALHHLPAGLSHQSAVLVVLMCALLRRDLIRGRRP